MKGQDYKPTGMEKFIGQWPGIVGFFLLVAGFGYIWYAKTYPPYVLYYRPAALLFAGAIVFLGYWALVN